MAAKKDTKDDNKKEKYTFFWRKESPFSQWHACRFTVADVEYNCTEQYMMHQKALLFGDKVMAAEIMATVDPGTQKACGRKVTNFDPNIWNENCRDIVKKGNLAKFSQNEGLWKEMAATAGTVLVEAAPRDRIWGIGLGANNPKARNKMTWRGKNWLGYTLTQVRDQLMVEKGEDAGKVATDDVGATAQPDRDEETTQDQPREKHSKHKKRPVSSSSKGTSKKSKS